MPWDPWELFNWSASLGFTVSLVPQLLRTLRLRRADDISRRFLVLVNLAAALMLVYSLHVGNWVFAAAQVANLLVWGTVLWFRLQPAAGSGAARPA
ncbi:MAG: PQ-loop domain-containing transporter [Thermoplasmatota archaeon]|nr:hypothetical protein [Halobacteriales archaeon]